MGHEGTKLESNGLDLVLLPFASRPGDELSCSSKPQKPMNKTKYKTQNKYLIGSDLLL